MKAFIGPYPNGNKKRKIKIKIDDYDLWNADMTIAIILVPLLKQLKNSKSGAPHVSNEDVPKHLHSTSKDQFEIDDLYFNRWKWVLDELIWTFKQIKKEVTLVSTKKEKRISNGLRLFGKYYRHLWT